MPPPPPLTFQTSSTFLFAYTESTLLRHAYGTDGISPFERPQPSRLDNSSLEHLAFLLSGYDFAAEAWTTSSTRHREVRHVASNNTNGDDASPPPSSSHWTISSSSKGKPGMEMYGRHQGTETPFATSAEAHTCCVELTSPAFLDTAEGWHTFAESIARIMGRLQRPGYLFPSSSKTGGSGHQHLAWVNETCGFSVVVRAGGGGDGETAIVAWPALQNLYALWDLHDGGGCGDVSRSQPIRHHIYNFPTLRIYFDSGLQSSRQEEDRSSQISLLTDDTKGEQCMAVKFDESRLSEGFWIDELLSRTHLIVQAVEACGELAAKGRRV
ncbi:MAG: hypothetical protein Q9222_002237 [Ikaeria aurantiellina]